MKRVAGIWLPDDDEHFAGHLASSEQYAGAGTYQIEKIRLALARTNRRRTAVDIGGHVGLWSRVLAGDFEKVIAVEPVPALVECFLANTEDCGNVKLIAAAASNVSGETTIETVKANSGNCKIAADPSASAIRVSAIRIDDLDLSGVDLVKIDVEGWEYNVLLGAHELIRRQKPIVVVEQKPGNAEHYGFDRYAPCNLLKAWGARELWVKAGDHCFGWK